MSAWLIALIAAAGLWLLVIIGLLLAGRGAAARELAIAVPSLVRLFGALARDRRLPWTTRGLLFLGIVWFASPIDLVPEFIPVIGPLDDVIVAVLILRRVVRSAGPELVAEHWRGGPQVLAALLRGCHRTQASPLERYMR